MATETIVYDKIKGVHKIPLEEFYTSGHRTCQGCESATTMRAFIKVAGPRTVVTGSTGKATYKTAGAAPSGCYTTSVSSVTASGLTWDGVTPANQYCF